MIRRGRREGSDIGVLLMLFQLYQLGFDKIPPVTLGIIGLNTGLYMGIIQAFLNLRMPIKDVCLNYQYVWHYKDYSRIYTHAFFHSNDMHLYYNMVSFVFKGIYLEKKLGWKRFLLMIVVFTPLCAIITMYLDSIFATVLNNPSYLHACGVGFSGVIFALKVLVTHYQPTGTTYLLGLIPVWSKYAYWAELILISVLVPNASFTGHLAGIIVGLMYVKGPLAKLMRPIENILFNFTTNTDRRYTYASGRSRSTNTNEQYNNYGNGLSEEEQIRLATEESLNSYHNQQHRPVSNNLYPDLSSENVPPYPVETVHPTYSSIPTAPPPEPGWNIPEDNSEELRQARLRRFR